MADLFDRILMLKKAPIFAHVDTESLRVVAQELVEEMYFKGERVFDIGEEGDHVYIVESGKVGVSIQPDPGVREFIATLVRGDCFGEMNMFDDLPRSATIHVVEDAKLLSLEKNKLRGLIMKHPGLGLGLLRGMSLRLRATNMRALENKK